LRFETPLGTAVAWLREEAGQGALLLRLDVTHNGRYIEPRRHSAFGALAFCEVPEILGSSTLLRLTAVPLQWLDYKANVLAVLRRSGFAAHIVGRTLEIRSEALSPSSLLRQAGPALFALDFYSRDRVSRADFEAVRRAAARAFKNEGDEVLDLLDESSGAYRLRQVFAGRVGPSDRSKREESITAALTRVETNKLVHFHCGSGQLLRTAMASGHFLTVAGVEPSSILLARAKARLESVADVYHGSLLEPPAGLDAGAIALLVDALPLPLDKRLERVAMMLFGEIGFEFVLCAEAADGHRWSRSELDNWARSISSTFSYQMSLLKLGADYAVLFCRGQNSPERRSVKGIWEPEIRTKLGLNIRIDLPQWKHTLEAFSKWTVDPRWLIYLPSGLCSLQTKEVTGFLEHPKAAFQYYRLEGIPKVVVEFKHMGSRAIVIVCRDDSAALRRFGVRGLGCVYTRNGRPFWEDPTPALSAIRDGLNRAQFWNRFKTDWVCLDGELLPWALKAEDLIEDSHGEMLKAGEAVIEELQSGLAHLSPAELPHLDKRKECYRRYRILHEQYQAEAGDPFRFAPFHLIASEGRSYFDRNHNWHMEVLQSLVRRAGDPFSETLYRMFSLDDERAIEECCVWWDELSQSGAEGLVVKPLYFVPRGRRGLAQPGIKCRGSEHLRMVYGPEYDLVENRWELASRDALKRRREKHRRVVKQFALSVEGVERFLRREAAGNIEMCVRGVLSLER